MLDRETLRLCMHVTRRNWTVYRKDFIANVSPTVADPAFFLLSLGLGLGAMVSSVQGRSYLEYLAPGLAVSTALFTSFFESSYGFFVRLTYENIFKAMMATPMGPREIITGEFIWVSIKGGAMALGVSLFLALVGLMPEWQWLGGMFLVGALVAFPCGALGLMATAWVRNINQFQTIYSFFLSPLFFFSGIFFPIEQMPKALQVVAFGFPLAHGVKLSQAFFWGEGIAHGLLVHGGPLILQGVVLGAFAYLGIRRKLQS